MRGNRGLNTQHVLMGLEPGVMEDKTKPMENEKWINDGQEAGDVDRRTRIGTDFGGSRDRERERETIDRE